MKRSAANGKHNRPRYHRPLSSDSRRKLANNAENGENHPTIDDDENYPANDDDENHPANDDDETDRRASAFENRRETGNRSKIVCTVYLCSFIIRINGVSSVAGIISENNMRNLIALFIFKKKSIDSV